MKDSSRTLIQTQRGLPWKRSSLSSVRMPTMLGCPTAATLRLSAMRKSGHALSTIVSTLSACCPLGGPVRNSSRSRRRIVCALSTLPSRCDAHDDSTPCIDTVPMSCMSTCTIGGRSSASPASLMLSPASCDGERGSSGWRAQSSVMICLRCSILSSLRRMPRSRELTSSSSSMAWREKRGVSMGATLGLRRLARRTCEAATRGIAGTDDADGGRGMIAGEPVLMPGEPPLLGGRGCCGVERPPSGGPVEFGVRVIDGSERGVLWRDGVADDDPAALLLLLLLDMWLTRRVCWSRSLRLRRSSSCSSAPVEVCPDDATGGRPTPMRPDVAGALGRMCPLPVRL
eukprot:PhM_4_TR1995/c0_g1_i1/m.8969